MYIMIICHGAILHYNTVCHQGCQLWMRVRREICEARLLAAYKFCASPKKADERGGGGEGGLRHFFFLPQKFWQPFSHSRHIVGVPFVHHKPLTSKKKKKNCVRYFHIYAWEREIQVKWGEVRESHAQCVRVGSPVSFKTISGRSDGVFLWFLAILHFLKIKNFFLWIHQNYLVALTAHLNVRISSFSALIKVQINNLIRA